MNYRCTGSWLLAATGAQLLVDVEQAMYVSRAGFYVSTQPTFLRAMYRRVITAMSPNPGLSAFATRKSSPRGTLVHFATGTASNTEPQVTVSVPVDSDNYCMACWG